VAGEVPMLLIRQRHCVLVDLVSIVQIVDLLVGPIAQMCLLRRAVLTQVGRRTSVNMAYSPS
jgi:hypothetical protein